MLQLLGDFVPEPSTGSLPLNAAGGLLSPLASLQERLPPLGPNSDILEPPLLALNILCVIV